MDLPFAWAIDPCISPAPLWPAPTSPQCEVLSPDTQVLRISLKGQALRSLAREADSLQTGFLTGELARSSHVCLRELHWTEAPHASVTVRLDPRRFVSTRAKTVAVTETVQPLGQWHATTTDTESLGFLRLLGVYSRIDTGIRLSLRALYPLCFFELRPLPQKPKFVASPLLADLLKRRSTEFRCGFVTLDQELRVLLLLPSDPLVLTCPLVGVWAAGTNDSVERSSLVGMSACSRLWEVCTEYVTHPQIRNRTGTASGFLLLSFSATVKCWHVSMRRAAEWRELSWTAELPAESGDVEATLWPADSQKCAANTQACRAVSGASTASTLTHSYEEAEKDADASLATPRTKRG